jgi:L-seryl-tRNA(Ser) seleniumtransferase
MAYVKRDHDAVPVLRMMRLSKDDIAHRVEKLAATVTTSKLRLELIDGESLIGGGAAPSAVLPTRLAALTHLELSADELCARLRAYDPPIVARVEEGRVLLDLRTVFPEQDEVLARAVSSLN